jgi:DNA-binding transcriptional MocR family regulator
MLTSSRSFIKHKAVSHQTVERRIAELATDGGADLRYLFGWREPVEPRQERVVQGCRDCQRRQRAGQNIAATLVPE